MSRLPRLAPRLGSMPPRLSRQTDAEGHSTTAEPWRKWYWSARWKALRMQVFLRDGFTCQCGCGHIEGDTSKLVGDHKEPHRGDEALFWNPDNVQTLYKPCHDSTKQSAERRAIGQPG